MLHCAQSGFSIALNTDGRRIPMKRKLSILISTVLVFMLILSLVPAGASAAGSGSAGVVSVSWGSLNVRSTPSTSGTILTSLPKGTYVTLLSKSGNWWHVEYAKGRYGYCSADYIAELSTYNASTTATLNVRTGPGTEYGVIDWLANGQNVIVLSSSGKWRNVLYNGTKLGYVSGNYLTTGTTSATTYSPVSLSVPRYRQTDSRWAYVEVGSSGKTIGMIGCATTALAMTESYRTGTTITPSMMEAGLKYTAGGSVYWPSNYRANTNSGYLKTLYDLLKAGKPAIIGFTNSYGSQHWVVVTGFTGGSSLSASAFTINDPGTNRATLQELINSYPNFYKIMHY
jgi:uncharacterized protein YgiM (DUF1202 family)